MSLVYTHLILSLTLIFVSCGKGKIEVSSVSNSDDTIASNDQYYLKFVNFPIHSKMNTVISPTIIVEVVNQNGNKVSDYNGQITLSIDQTYDPSLGNATLLGTLTQVVINGVASFNDIMLDTAGFSYKVTASSTGLSSISSHEFDIFPSNPVYRSMGFNSTSALQTDNSTIDFDIVDNVITFSEDISTNVGIGDIIQYDFDSNTIIDTSDKLAVIYGRFSKSSFAVKSITGQSLSNISGVLTWSIFRAYTSFSNADAGIENTGIDTDLVDFDTHSQGEDLVSVDVVWNVALYADSNEIQDRTVIEGWTTDSSHYLRFYTPFSSLDVYSSQRHAGKWSEQAYQIRSTYCDYGLKIRDKFVHLEGMQIDSYQCSTGYSPTAIWGTPLSGIIHIRDNIIRNSQAASVTSVSTGKPIGINIEGASASIWYVYNNIIYDFYRDDGNGTGIRTTYSQEHIYNNTLINNWVGINATNNGSTVINNIVQDSVTDFTGTFLSGSSYNISDISTPPGTNPQTGTVLFLDKLNHDYSLDSADTIATEGGTNLSGVVSFPFFRDISGSPRGTNWNIGAH